MSLFAQLRVNNPGLRVTFPGQRNNYGLISECYDHESEMGELTCYFVYEAFGRELFMYDYPMGANNHVFRTV